MTPHPIRSRAGLPAARSSQRVDGRPASAGRHRRTRSAVTIDGKRGQGAAGHDHPRGGQDTLGIRIPTLCYHPDLCVAGVCRICVVEVEGQRTLQAACAFPITAPIKVHTHTRKVRQARRHILDLLLSSTTASATPACATTTASCRRWPRNTASTSIRFGHSRSRRLRGRPLQLLGRARHEQVRALPPLRPHLHRPAGSRRARGHRPRRPDPDLDLPGQAARRRGLHQLRAVHQPLPDRRPARQRPDRRGVGAPSTTPTKHVVIQTAPSPRAAIGECFGLRARHARDLRDEHGAARAAASTRCSTPTSPPT